MIEVRPGIGVRDFVSYLGMYNFIRPLEERGVTYVESLDPREGETLVPVPNVFDGGFFACIFHNCEGGERMLWERIPDHFEIFHPAVFGGVLYLVPFLSQIDEKMSGIRRYEFIREDGLEEKLRGGE